VNCTTISEARAASMSGPELAVIAEHRIRGRSIRGARDCREAHSVATGYANHLARARERGSCPPREVRRNLGRSPSPRQAS